ncbi:hypothetical protein A2291_00010 [candidate division WOR-1 bacterium RIFOXYB2_FULL_42_35]|uniref:Ketoreductase domain-containing protein n=1 Tax=candidate division WOR-1 bacterium RIFOXYC2_FULL_41_25 TaxID=1802586 RepID=A0A1F4TM35_UNCSA|nr:MAG: hypothetical protein A2247_05530 [candidate division WOR-1 bacterium RIFOXYA2_FULL_41_14]OGC24105.1 MAG: hypothetical protein A2291_00010 [candidate division WOR-1 bacterium RIFOXYB2_FULL_42_35]OGC33792.1 MAG: hypothetical protein A2462_01685 [candidate division WOR-1 bacterium RIFOXYC2_FULL_41_25]
MKTAIVTGGSRGIGEAIALALSGEKIKVLLTYQKMSKKAHLVVKTIRAAGGEAEAFPLDLTRTKSVYAFAAKMKKDFGPINILINNASFCQEKEPSKITDKDWDEMLAANLKSPFILSQELLSAMKKKHWGRIINISSIGGQLGGVRQVHYAAAKAALINLTRSLAKVSASQGITVNAVAPGLINTEMIKKELHSKLGKKKLATIPMGRIGTPQEVASAVCFLVSNEAAYITGQTINVNGGLYFA